MKTIILSILFSIIGISAYSQIDYPKYQIDSLGQKVVVLTIEQAQRLDNNSDLLSLFEKLNTQIGEYDSICLKVINDKDLVIAKQKVEVSSLNRYLENKDNQILILKKTIEEYKFGEKNLSDQILIKDGIIGEKDSQIRKIKWKSIGIGSTVGILVGIVFTLIVIN